MKKLQKIVYKKEESSKGIKHVRFVKYYLNIRVPIYRIDKKVRRCKCNTFRFLMVNGWINYIKGICRVVKFEL